MSVMMVAFIVIVIFILRMFVYSQDKEINSLKRERDFYKESLRIVLQREEKRDYIDPDSICLEELFSGGKRL